MEAQVAEARRRLAARDEALVGVVRVAAIDDIGGILSPIVASFRVNHPGVTVAVEMRSGFADLARQQADVAIRISTRPPGGDPIAKHIATGGRFYGSRAYFTEHGRPARVEALRDHAIVRGDEGPDARRAHPGQPFQRRPGCLSLRVEDRAPGGGGTASAWGCSPA